MIHEYEYTGYLFKNIFTSLSFTTKSLYIEHKNKLILSLLVITQHRNCEKKKKKLQTENEEKRQFFLLKKSFH